MKTNLSFPQFVQLNKCCRGLTRSLKSLTLLFLFGILISSTTTQAQIAAVNPPTGGFNIDGSLQANTSPYGDWLKGSGTGGYVFNDDGTPVDASKTFLLSDLYNSSGDDVFIDGDMAGDAISALGWQLKKAVGKDDIGHALFHVSKDANNDTWLMLGGDRLSSGSNSYIDFELLQNTVTKNPDGTFTGNGPNNGRTINDLLITVSYSGGSGGNFVFFKWTGSAWASFSPGGSPFAAINSTTVNVPFLAFGNTTYDPAQFIEGAVDVTAVINSVVQGGCPPGIAVKSVWVKTKTSGTGNGSLKDFMAPFNFSVNIGKPTTTDGARCGPGDVALHATADGSGYTLSWYSDAGLTNLVATGNDYTPNLSQTTTFYVTQTKDGCGSAATSVTATINDLPSAPSVGVTDNCDGTSTLTASGYTGSLLWSTNETTASINVTTAGTYTVTQTANGCTSEAGSGDANPKNGPGAPSVGVVDNCDGTSTLTASGYTGSLLWSTSETTASINVTSAGTYTVTQTVNGCTSAAGSGDANPKTTPSAPSVGVTDNCNGTSTLTASGYTGSLLWSTSETTASINVTSAGTYTVTQTVNGCTSSTGSGDANPKNGPGAPSVGVVDNCDGTSTLTASGYTGSLLWSTSETTASINVTSAGTYTVTQTVNGCTSAAGSGDANPKTTPSAPSVGVTDNCNGTSTLTASGYTGSLLWSTSETTASINVTSAGTYTVTQTVNGCTSSTGSGDANPKNGPGAPSVGVVDNCDGTSTLTASGYTGSLLWSTSETTASISVTSAGTYTVTQTVNGCTSQAGSGDANPKTTPSAPSVGVVNNCNGTSTLTASGYTGSLLWNTGAATSSITVSAAGHYTVTQTVNGCTSATGSGDANPKTTPAAPSVSGTTVCSPNSATASASGCSGTLTWYDAATNGNVVATGVSSITTSTTKTYYVSCTVNGCESARKAVTATVNICSGIYPTSSSCAGFNSGTLQYLSRVCVTTKKKGSTTNVTNATPGVFFYYTKITAPAADFYVYLDETQCSSLNKPFLIANGQILAYKDNCNKLATGTAMTNGDGVIHITKATAGQPVVIGVKYDVKSVNGATVTGTFPCTANFVMRSGSTNAAPVIANTSANLIIGANCSVSAIATTLQTDDDLKVTAYPNPYKSQVSFRFTSPVSGKAVLVAYDLLGKKLAIVFEGNVEAGVEHVVKYNVPAGNRVNMIYKLTVGDKTYHAMLISEK